MTIKQLIVLTALQASINILVSGESTKLERVEPLNPHDFSVSDPKESYFLKTLFPENTSTMESGTTGKVALTAMLTGMDASFNPIQLDPTELSKSQMSSSGKNNLRILNRRKRLLQTALPYLNKKKPTPEETAQGRQLLINMGAAAACALVGSITVTPGVSAALAALCAAISQAVSG